MDNDTSSGTGATPTPDSQPAKGNAPDGAMPQKPSVTLEEALAQITELKHQYSELEKTHRNATGELKRHREKLTTYEEAERQAQEAQLTEIERIKKQHTDLQAQHDAYVQHAQERLVRYEVQQQAAKLGIIDPDAATKLLDWSELEYDENGTPNNATKLLEKLLKNKPYLAPAPSQPDTQPSPEQPGTPTRRAAPAIPAMQPGRSNIPAPGSTPPGRIPRLSDPGVLVPPGTPSRYQP